MVQTAAASAALTLDSLSAPSGLRASDFTVEATLDENFITLDDLIDHSALAKLLASNRTLYVMNAGGNYRALVYMRQQGSTWLAAQVHGSDRGNLVGNGLSSLKQAHKADGNDYFYVEVPAMHLKLLGHKEKGVLMLTTLEDRPDLGLVANTTEPASQLLAALVPYAQRWLKESTKFFATGSR